MLQTPLYQMHVDSGARMVDFAGWSMPVVYTSILDEHVWTRTQIGLFDVSHMGRLEINGPAAGEMLENLCTRELVDLSPGQTRYCLMCRPDGGILDDLMVSRLKDEQFYIVCNASNRAKIVAHIEEHLAPGATLIDRTQETAMLAIQGPKVIEMIMKLFPGPLAQVPHRRVYTDKIMGIKYHAFRGGYTGEDGFEVVVPAYVAPMVWAQLISATLDDQPVVKPAGLGARDTLRLEAALPLYGHELSEQIDPLSARLDFAVNFANEFIGKPALEKIRKDGPAKVRVGLKLQTRRAARQGFKIFSHGKPCGEITSGAMTPTVNASIAMGYIETALSQVGTTVQIQIGTEFHDAEIVAMPFYHRKKQNSK